MRFIKRNLGKISLVLFFINSAIAGVLLANMGAFETVQGESPLLLVLKFAVMLLGAYVCLGLHVICHELGHLIGGVKVKYTFLSFAVGPLTFEKQNGKIVLKWKSFKGIGGLCRMFPSKDNKEEDFAKYIRGGLIASAIITAVFLLIFGLCFALSYIQAFKWIAIFFALSYPLSLYVLLNNMAVVKLNNAMTDGAYLESIKNKDLSGIALLSVINYQSYVASGVRPKDVPKEIIESIPVLPDDDGIAPVLASNIFSYYIDTGDMEKIAYATEKIANSLPYSAEVYIEDLKADLLYGYSVIGNVEKAAELYQELKEKSDYSSLRSLCAYFALIEKDLNKAKEYGEKALQIINNIPLKGMVESEREIMTCLLNK